MSKKKKSDKSDINYGMIQEMFEHYANKSRPSKITWDNYYLVTGWFLDKSAENRYLKIKKTKR